jgi:hypothetical protein
VVGVDAIGRHSGLVDVDFDGHPGNLKSEDVTLDRLDYPVRILLANKARGDVAGCHVRDDGILSTADDTGDLERRTLPQPLKSRVTGFTG